MRIWLEFRKLVIMPKREFLKIWEIPKKTAAAVSVMEVAGFKYITQKKKRILSWMLAWEFPQV